MEQDELIAHLRWVLERQLHWIGTADVKAGGLIGIYMALTAVAATLLDSAEPSASAKALFILAGLALLPALALAVAVFFPRDSSQRRSSIFFGEIAATDLSKFIEAGRLQNNAIVADDLLGQIHINAKIATCKHAYAKNSIIFGAVSLALWLGAIATFVGE
ncbi:Pycsar system effector family protein [Stenotrophomonas sp. S39]|uniref:Pycsar system effector family protein n=1 Tax=Stenotrophomonas sp. S39 TaxID=2767451 RepID=UPI00190A5412|nr:Pycsar system effector family protein [Stenotrophomonas sp. S39]MBK0054711.1 hypothetical protein [Stenotrophomonas sp. S39]